ncbi:MAG TPA: lytic transglycosylase domain-containing protein [Thermoanaerobaculia bacterium]|nr:lytic transglycosylase domain-containing protein [Thermoanaerobaculia bacterium]
MRAGAAALVLVLAAATAGAEVRVGMRDGKKIIYNVPSGKSRPGNYEWLARQHDRRTRYDALIEHYARQYRVDPVLIRAVIQVESDFNPQCVSKKGARGLMQLMPGTARRYKVTDVHDPAQNIRGGVHYLRDLLEMFRDDLTRALAAYNAGENAVIRHGGIPPYEETITYVKRALTVYYGRPHYDQAISFSGRREKATLRGGFTSHLTEPLAAVVPGMRYLGTH